MSEQQTSVNDENLEVISKVEFDKVYNTLQKERTERKELEKSLNLLVILLLKVLQNFVIKMQS
jgi:hypothetical protein